MRRRRPRARGASGPASWLRTPPRRCGGDPAARAAAEAAGRAVRPSDRTTGSRQRRPSSRARRSAGWWPRRMRFGRRRADERYAVGGRAGEAVGDDVRRELGHAPEPALLPRGHDRRDGCLVGHGRARGGEREPPAEHSRQRRTGQAVGAPQRSQCVPSRSGRGPAVGQRSSPRRAQETQRRGSRRSRTTRLDAIKSARVAHGSAPGCYFSSESIRRAPGAPARSRIRLSATRAAAGRRCPSSRRRSGSRTPARRCGARRRSCPARPAIALCEVGRYQGGELRRVRTTP